MTSDFGAQFGGLLLLFDRANTCKRSARFRCARFRRQISLFAHSSPTSFITARDIITRHAHYQLVVMPAFEVAKYSLPRLLSLRSLPE